MTLPTADQQRPQVAIIGGGLSGLATGYFLHRSGHFDVTIFEASHRTGGVIHTEPVGDFLVDHGADMFATKPDAAVRLCAALGVEDELIHPESQRRGAKILRDGQCVAIPEGFVLMRATRTWPMLTTRLLSPLGKLRFLAERWIAARPRGQENGENAPSDESVADFVRRRMGQQVLDRIVAPLAAGIYTADVSKLSMRATMGPIDAMQRQYGSLYRATQARRRSGEDSVERTSTGARYGQFRAFSGGMVKLIEHLSEALPTGCIRTNAPVTNLDRDAAQWTVTGQDQTSKRFDQVVLATPAATAAKLLGTITDPASKLAAGQAASGLASIESASAAIVVLGVRAADIGRSPESFGVVVPLSENRKVLAISFASNKFAGRAPQDHVLIRTFVGGAMQPELLDQDDDQLITMVRDELRDIIGLGGSPVISQVVRWNDAMPQYHVGHLDTVKKIESSMDSINALTLLGNALHGVGIAPLIAQAEKKANQMIQASGKLA